MKSMLEVSFLYSVLILLQKLHLVYQDVIRIKDRNYENLVDDITRFCHLDYIADYFIPYGAGIVDGRMIMITSPSFNGDCSIRISGPENTKNVTYNLIVVIELENYRHPKSKMFSCDKKNIVIGMETSEVENMTYICDEFKQEDDFEIFINHFPSKKIQIFFHFANFSGNMRMTVSSARFLGEYGFCHKNEIMCLIRKKMVCVDHRLKCDGRKNCGSKDRYDENPRRCLTSAVPNLLLMTFYGLLLAFMLILIITALLRMCVPHVADHFFIFNEDEDNKLLLTTESRPPKGVNQAYLDAISEKYESKKFSAS